jgi:hypothetical protein
MATEKRLASALGPETDRWQIGRLALEHGSIFANPLALRILGEDAESVARRG